MSDTPEQPASNLLIRAIERIGLATQHLFDKSKEVVAFVGSITALCGETFRWMWRSTHRRDARVSRDNIFTQMVRVGLRSIPIIMLVEGFIGIILCLQMAPTLEAYGQLDNVAYIVVIAMFRELGPLMAGIVLSGFAGASIAAELGTMVEGEEIKALRAVALNPIRFLVVPRFLATVTMLTMLSVLADVIGVLGGLFTATAFLGIDAHRYLNYTRMAVTYKDFVSGIGKAACFGAMIALIACQEGLNVKGGAEGVGRATTNTVVKSIVALITADVVFTMIFYAFGI